MHDIELLSHPVILNGNAFVNDYSQISILPTSTNYFTYVAKPMVLDNHICKLLVNQGLLSKFSNRKQFIRLSKLEQ